MRHFFVMLLVLSSLVGCQYQREVSTLGNQENHPSLQLAGMKSGGTLKDVDPQLPDNIGVLRVELEASGTRAPIEDWPAGQVLHEAAEFYAALTGDFEVSIKDVLDAGIWPYNTIPGDTDLSQSIYGGDFHALILEDNIVDKKQLLLQARYQILRKVFAALYSTSGVGAVSYGAPGSLEKIPQFWVNPLSGQPMTESDRKGDYSLFRVGELPKDARIDIPDWVELDWYMPVVNPFDRAKYEVSEAPIKGASDTEMCCWLTNNQTNIPANQEKCKTFECACGEETWYCTVCWAFDCVTTLNEWNYVLAPCDDPPATGGIGIPCDQATPVRNTLFRNSCNLVYVNSTGQCSGCIYLPDGWCFDEIGDFINDLNSSKQWIDIPGEGNVATCGCP